jgi:threonine/homoserine/homoserine lactone efflux protein
MMREEGITIDFLLKGIIIGVSIAAPVGPIGLVCIQRTLMQGRVSGFVSGLGAATADAIYGSVAGFGLDIVSNFLVSQQAWIRLLGGGLLCYLGVRSLFAKPADQAVVSKNSGLFWNYASTLLLTITNPMTILSFVAVFAALGVVNSTNNYVNAVFTVLGVFLGSGLWWFILSISTGLLRTKLHSTALRWINRISGSIIVAFGVYGIWASGLL